MLKRGQAAAFIIIGLVILAVLIGFMAIKKGSLSDLFSGITSERVNVPQQVKGIQNFLDSCVTGITNEGITQIGLQGGYVDLKDDDITTPFTPLGKSLEIIPDSNFKTAVWFRESGNGIQELNVPSTNDIEDELKKHVENEFSTCIFNLTSFEKEGYLFSADGVPKADVTLADSRVSVIVNFPINIKIGDTNFTLTQHSANIDSGLGKLFNVAKEIMQRENQDYFLENKTIDTLVAYDPEVPFTGTDLSCSEKTWLKSDVEMRLKNILFENVAAMKVKNTNYKSNERFKYLEFDALNNKENVDVNFMYIPNWPTLVEINPSEGGILKSDLISKKAGGDISGIVSSFFCLNHHRFVYDIKYPVLITIRDDKGLVFQYATEVIIDNNEPRLNRREILDLPDPESKICKYPQKDVSVFTGFINENNDLVPLDNVNLNFKCFPASCPVGISSFNSDGNAVLNAKVPLCFNGVLQGSKEGYKQVQKTLFSSNEDVPGMVLVQLEKLYKKKVNLHVIEKITGKEREPYESEQINFQFIREDTEDQVNFIYPDQNEIELLPGKYKVNSYLLRNSSSFKITIPKEKIDTCVDTKDLGLFEFFAGKKACNSFETEAMEFDTVLTGGAVGVEHEFTRQQLGNEDPLNLYILSSDIPSNIDDLQKIQIGLETNKEHPLFKEPSIGRI